MRLAADQKSWRRISDGRESVCVVRGINRCARLLPWALRTGYQLVGDALELARRRGARLNAVAVTAYARSEDKLRALQAGYEWHLAKPIEPSELVSIIASLVHQPVGDVRTH
jgi:CheY-like chemotaxis protein